MNNRIHPELKKAGIAVRYFSAKGKDYSRDLANKMFNQNVNKNAIDERLLHKILKQLISEQIELTK